jgi:DNA-binding NarL/FixJ family response regulator
MDKITLIIIDDHPLFRQGVVNALSLEEDILVIGEASSGEQGIELIRRYLPKVALVDVNMPGMNGQQMTRLVMVEKLPTRIVLMTAYDDVGQMIHAMSVGASAYCSKEIQPESLVYTIRTAAMGKYVMDGREFDADGLKNWLETQVEGALREYSDPGEPYMPLSDREMEVLTYVTRGLSNKEIATLLGISHQTVKNHVTSILRKLGVDDRTQAALYALRRGWLRLQDH